MNPHDWYVEHRLDFVTRTLDAGEEASFADHLRRCEECQAAVTALEHELGWLPMGAGAVKPRPGFRRQVVQRILGEGRPAWRGWIAPLAVAASLAIAAGLGIGGYLPERREALRLAEALDSRSKELSMLRDSISVMHQASRVVQTTISMDGHQGGMLIFADETSHRWNVVVHGLPAAPPGETYQFWFICSDGMVRGATLTSDPSRPAFLTLGMPKEGGAVMGGALTIESTANVSRAPQGKQLAHFVL